MVRVVRVLHRYNWRLVAFARAEVPAGEQATVPVDITGDALAFPDRGDGSASPRYPQRVFGGVCVLEGREGRERGRGRNREAERSIGRQTDR